MQTDIPTTLASFIDKKRSAPFVWGVNDCCLYAADWVHALTGQDPMKEFRGAYSNAREACTAWRLVGGYAAEGARRLEGLGWERVPASFASRGCIALVKTHRHHESFGVVECGRVALYASSGLVFVPISQTQSFWRPPLCRT